MKTYINIGSSPYGEDCAQLGTRDYLSRSRKELRVYLDQLKRCFPLWEKTGVVLKIMGFAHDFGMYHEVVCCYDDENEEQKQFAFDMEGGGPEYWDDLAKEELRKEGIHV